MKRTFITLLLSMVPVLGALAIEEVYEYPEGRLQASVWLDEENGAVHQPGETVEIYFRATEDCYVAVYDIDTDGFLSLLYPRSGHSGRVLGEHIYSIPDERDDYELIIDGEKGIEYVVAIASPYPLNFDALYENADLADGTLQAGRVTGAPHLAIFELNNELTWGRAEEADGYSSDIAWFYVRDEVPYPRYVVYSVYPDRIWDPYWDPYCVHFDYRWDHNWCRPWWWHRGYTPSYHYWYYSGGVQVTWHYKYHHSSGNSHWKRYKAKRTATRWRNKAVRSKQVRSNRKHWSPKSVRKATPVKSPPSKVARSKDQRRSPAPGKVARKTESKQAQKPAKVTKEKVKEEKESRKKSETKSRKSRKSDSKKPAKKNKRG